MRKRVISGVIITLACIGFGLYGGTPLGVVLMICSLIGYYELTRALNVFGAKEGSQEKFNGLVCIGWAGTLIYYIVMIVFSFRSGAAASAALKSVWRQTYAGVAEKLFLQQTNALMLGCIIGVFLSLMAVYVLTFPKYQSSQVVGAFFSFVYCPVMISFAYRAVFLPYGRFVYALIFLCSWVCDTCAFAVGMKFGKHRLAPVLSPKKSVEGALGGVAGSAIASLIAAIIVGRMHPGEHLELAFVIIGICGSIISQIGDLAASAIKRNHGVKDYGKCIPGHGGIMDRFDSMIFTAPLIYSLAALFLTVLK